MSDPLRQAAHCPHCNLVLAEGVTWPYPAAADRCPHCRLIVGPGRAQERTGPAAERRSRGSAAGMLANSARRADLAPGDPAAVNAALIAVADAAGASVERLRMLDYQEASDRDPALPGLATVLATHATWKAARRFAAESADSVEREGAPV